MYVVCMYTYIFHCWHWKVVFDCTSIVSFPLKQFLQGKNYRIELQKYCKVFPQMEEGWQSLQEQQKSTERYSRRRMALQEYQESTKRYSRRWKKDGGHCKSIRKVLPQANTQLQYFHNTRAEVPKKEWLIWKHNLEEGQS